MQGFPGKKAQKAPASVWASAFHPRSRSKMLRCRQRKGLHPDNFLFTNPARIVTIKSNPSAVRCVLLPGSVRPAALHPQTFSRLWHSAGPRRRGRRHGQEQSETPPRTGLTGAARLLFRRGGFVRPVGVENSVKMVCFVLEDYGRESVDRLRFFGEPLVAVAQYDPLRPHHPAR